MDKKIEPSADFSSALWQPIPDTRQDGFPQVPESLCEQSLQSPLVRSMSKRHWLPIIARLSSHPALVLMRD
eukprot:scaffold4547_cov103-Cylindrotheca_fusiformis.AAC.5